MIRAPQLDHPRSTGRGVDSLDPDFGHTDIGAINRFYACMFFWIGHIIFPYLILRQPRKSHKRDHWYTNLRVIVFTAACHDRWWNIWHRLLLRPRLTRVAFPVKARRAS
jgi:hypothetical protein